MYGCLCLRSQLTVHSLCTPSRIHAIACFAEHKALYIAKEWRKSILPFETVSNLYDFSGGQGWTRCFASLIYSSYHTFEANSSQESKVNELQRVICVSQLRYAWCRFIQASVLNFSIIMVLFFIDHYFEALLQVQYFKAYLSKHTGNQALFHPPACPPITI